MRPHDRRELVPQRSARRTDYKTIEIPVRGTTARRRAKA
jgi:hypothetical protein